MNPKLSSACVPQVGGCFGAGFGLLAFGIMLGAGPVGGADADGSTRQVRALELVTKVAALWREAPPADSEAVAGQSSDNPRYLPALAGLERPDLQAALRPLLDDPQFKPLERRVVEVLLARVATPRSFELVTPYLVPVAPARTRDRPRTLAGREPSATVARVQTVEVLSPQVRKVLERYPDLFTEARRQADERSALRANGGDRDRDYLEFDRECSQWREEVINTRDIHPDMLMLIVYAAEYSVRYVSLDPAHLLAWEEALCRASNWPMKEELTEVVLSFRAPASVPVLGLVLRQALPCLSLRTGGTQRSTVGRILMFFVELPAKPVALELSRILAGMSKEHQAVMATVLVKLGDPPWRDFLAKLDADAEWREHVARLREAAERAQAYLAQPAAAPQPTPGQ